MNYEKINKILSNIPQSEENTDLLTFLEKRDVHLGVSNSSYGEYGEGVQGEEDVWYDIYSIKDESNIFLKVTRYTDSYGDGEFLRGVAFVKPKQVKVTEYTELVEDEI